MTAHIDPDVFLPQKPARLGVWPCLVVGVGLLASIGWCIILGWLVYRAILLLVMP
ncbi:MAG TPA: hypothetical protein VKB76_09370 [Ktedonobacterales bacterium]|nr:hypothetical protein [Ktedonobacterales bacterium]